MPAHRQTTTPFHPTHPLLAVGAVETPIWSSHNCNATFSLSASLRYAGYSGGGGQCDVHCGHNCRTRELNTDCAFMFHVSYYVSGHHAPWCQWPSRTLVSVAITYLGVSGHHVPWCQWPSRTLVSVAITYLGVSGHHAPWCQWPSRALVS